MVKLIVLGTAQDGEFRVGHAAHVVVAVEDVLARLEGAASRDLQVEAKHTGVGDDAFALEQLGDGRRRGARRDGDRHRRAACAGGPHLAHEPHAADARDQQDREQDAEDDHRSAASARTGAGRRQRLVFLQHRFCHRARL